MQLSEYCTPGMKLEALTQIADLLQEKGGIEDFSKTLVAIVANALRVSACTFLLSQGPENLRRVVAIGSEIDSGPFLKEERQISEKVLKSQEIVIDEVKTIPGEDRRGQKSQIVFYAGIPVNIAGKIDGIIFIKSLHGLTSEDTDFLRMVATHVGLTVENIRVHEEMRLESAKFFSFVEIGKALTSILSMDELLNCITHTALQLAQGETASIMLVDDESDYLTIQTASGIHEDIVKASKVKMGEGIAGWVAETRTPLLISDISEDPRFRDLPRKSRKIRSAIVVPLEWNRKAIGVLSVDNVTSDYQFCEGDLQLLSILAGQAALAIQNTKTHIETKDLYVSTIRALASGVEAKDKYSVGHFDRVTRYSVAIAKKLGLPKADIEVIKYAAILHDIGKIDISAEILLKPGILTTKERELIKMHPRLGAKIIEQAVVLFDISNIVYHHHERYDGQGYLEGLKGEKIPLGSRILAVADVFEALTSARSYRKAISRTAAIDEIKECAGSQFDPEVVKAFLAVLQEELADAEKVEASASVRGE